MKKLLLGAAALTILASACKKDDDGGGSGLSNQFRVGSATFPATTVSSAASLISVGGSNGSNGGSMIFSFPGSAAPVAGTYKVVADVTGSGTVEFLASSSSAGSATAYASTGAGDVFATVTVNGGKITVSMPDAPAAAVSGGSGTVQVAANITTP